jgi:hypothetical protein
MHPSLRRVVAKTRAIGRNIARPLHFPPSRVSQALSVVVGRRVKTVKTGEECFESGWPRFAAGVDEVDPFA